MSVSLGSSSNASSSDTEEPPRHTAVYRAAPRMSQSNARRQIDEAGAAAYGGGGGSRPEKIVRDMLNREVGPCGQRRRKINLRELRRPAFHSRLRRTKGDPSIITVEYDYITHHESPPGTFKCVVEVHGPSHVSPQAQFGGVAAFHRTIEYDKHKEAWALNKGYMYYAISLNDPDLRHPYAYRECGDDVLVQRANTVITLIREDARMSRRLTHRQYIDKERAEREAEREMQRELAREARAAERAAEKMRKQLAKAAAMSDFIDDSNAE